MNPRPPRTIHSVEEKMQIILDILSRKATLGKIAADTGISPTLISLWKRQALEAIHDRFVPRQRGRKKAPPVLSPEAERQLRAARDETRAAKLRAARLEGALSEALGKLEKTEGIMRSLVSVMGFRLLKPTHARGGTREA